MITRPLDLAARLRPPPRNFDWVFLAVGGLIVLFFDLFGSRFVLAPGLGVDFRLPTMPGALAGASTTTAQLKNWLTAEAKTAKAPVLLVQASDDVPMAKLTEVGTIAREAGFAWVQFAANEPKAKPAGEPGAR